MANTDGGHSTLARRTAHAMRLKVIRRKQERRDMLMKLDLIEDSVAEGMFRVREISNSGYDLSRVKSQLQRHVWQASAGSQRGNGCLLDDEQTEASMRSTLSSLAGGQNMPLLKREQGRNTPIGFVAYHARNETEKGHDRVWMPNSPRCVRLDYQARLSTLPPP